MFLKVKIPKVCEVEQKYSLDILLGEFLGLSFEIESYDKDVIEITRCNEPEGHKVLKLDASFFHKADQSWLRIESMPIIPLSIWFPKNDDFSLNLPQPSVPVLYGKPGIEKSENSIYLGIDIFGSSFFMLSRYEELVIEKRDKHNRFPANESLAFKAGFLDRPIVNEYLEVLWECISKLWPDLTRKKREPKNFITCDVDWPFDRAGQYFFPALKRCARILIKEKKPLSAAKVMINYFAGKVGFNIKDKCRESIKWIMDVNEEAGNTVAFYFITFHTSKLDTRENMHGPKMRALFREIAERGHEIGLHPGYETYDNSENFKKSVEYLKVIFREENIEQKIVGGRQHFLRWDAGKTPKLWDENDLDYDSTLSFADNSGFRSGVCYEYSMYSLLDRKKLRVKQRPLILMESTVIAPRYEGLGYSEESLKKMNDLKEITHFYDGDFVLLWHNSHFENHKDEVFYRSLIEK